MKVRKPKGKKPSGNQPQPRRRAIRKRRNDEQVPYDYGDHSGGESWMPQDCKYILPDAPQFRLVRPTWDKGKYPLVFRALPLMNDDGDFLPGRKSPDPKGFSSFLRAVPMTKYFGLDRKISFILYDKRWKKSKGYNPDENPYIIFHRMFCRAVEDGVAKLGRKDVISAKWSPWLKSLKKRAVNGPTEVTFLPGAVFQNNDKCFVKGGGDPQGLGPDDWPVMIELAKTGGSSMIKRFNDRLPGADDVDSDDWVNIFVAGDPTDLETGPFITVYNPEYHTEVTGEDDDEDEDGGKGKKGKDESDFKGWKSIVSSEYLLNKKKPTSPDLSEYEDKIRKDYLWFSDVLHYPDHDEICRLMASAFRSEPNVLRFCWQDNPEFFTDDVKGILAARTSGPGAEVPSDDDDEDYDRRKKKKRRDADDDEDDDEYASDEYDDANDDDDDEEEEKPRQNKSKRKSKALTSAKSDFDDEDADDVEDDDEDDDEDESPRGKKPSGKSPASSKRRSKATDDEDDGDDDEDDEDDDDGDDDDAAEQAERRSARRSPPKKRKKVKGKTRA